MYYYDPEFYRQHHREKTAEIRAQYQHAQAWPRASESTRVVQWTRSVWERARSPRRAPAFRA